MPVLTYLLSLVAPSHTTSGFSQRLVVDHTEQLPRTSVMMEVFWLNQQGLVRMERGQEVNQAVGCLQVSRPTVSILDRIILHDVTLKPIMVFDSDGTLLSFLCLEA